MVEEASGAVTAVRARSARSLAEGDSVYVGDRVRTGDDARAVLRLEDGSRISLRPGSDFRVAELREETNEDGNSTFTGMFMDLLRGGLRVITGRVADRNSENYRLRTPVATIGVRGTEFSALMCARGDCPEDAGEVEEGPDPVARVLEVRGDARAEGPNGATRVLEKGAGIFRDDTVLTGSDAWVVLRFADQSKVSLQPGTEFRVDEWEFEADEPGAANALLNLVRGGMRVLTGLIGDATGQNYRVETPVATIGVRGTGFDLYCVGSCINQAATTVNSVSGDGLLVNTWDGEIVAQLEGRLVEFGAGQSGFIANATAAPLRLPGVPELLRDLPAPRPDTVTGSVTQGADRMYTSVEDGTITVQGAQGGPITLGAGEAAAVAAGGAARPLPSVPGALGAGLGVPAATLTGAVGQLMLAQFDLASLYAGGTTGTTRAGSRSSFENRVQRDFPGASVSKLESGFGGRVFGGFRLLGLLGVEVGYADLGEIDSAIDPGTADEAAVAEDALDKHPFTPRGLDVSAIAFAPGDLFGQTRAFARAGVFTWEGEIETTTPSGETFTKDVSGTDPLVGGGVEYRVGPRVHARAEWIRYELDPDPVNYVGAGVVWTLQ
ncbi:MAG: FecR family protein [Halofilum sp. (in: g-proteobacteria)]|nr:FecR family protein [Halofilum sp. (in: g-proteobacteria)]